MSDRTAAIVLAAGQGRRMNSSVQKQYLLLEGKPVLFYALDVFEKSAVDEIILVTGKDELSFCRGEIVEKYGFQKVSAIVEGGRERSHSVYEGLKRLSAGTDYVLIHDGARPLVSQRIIADTLSAVRKYKACVAGMPVKDTIKIADEEQFAKHTPERSSLWAVQTPQAFSYDIVWEAYSRWIEQEIPVTDDAMVVETFLGQSVKLIAGAYENIKITTPEDLLIAEILLKKQGRLNYYEKRK